jgi:hypothetical protein
MFWRRTHLTSFLTGGGGTLVLSGQAEKSGQEVQGVALIPRLADWSSCIDSFNRERASLDKLWVVDLNTIYMNLWTKRHVWVEFLLMCVLNRRKVNMCSTKPRVYLFTVSRCSTACRWNAGYAKTFFRYSEGEFNCKFFHSFSVITIIYIIHIHIFL